MMEWIEVDKSKPADQQEVLFFAKAINGYSPDIYAVALYEASNGTFFQYDHESEEYCLPTLGVYHWMPLPQPPIKKD